MPAADRSVLFVVRGDETVPSCRFRAYQFKEPLEKLGVRVGFLRVERSRNLWKQIGFHLRLARESRRYRAVIYQKLLEPGRLRWIRLFNPNLFYDFDDAMYLAPDGHRFPATMRAAPAIIAGNAVLAERARQYNPKVFILPTAVPEQAPTPPRPDDGLTRFSWIGTVHNLPNLAPVLAAMDTLHAEGAPFRLHVLTDKPEAWVSKPYATVEKWDREKEERDFRACDVGLMPLEDTEWNRGKCACKALQYLSYGKPIITAPVGVNGEIFAGMECVSLVRDAGEWDEALRGWIWGSGKGAFAGAPVAGLLPARFGLKVVSKDLKWIIAGSSEICAGNP